MLRRFLIGLLLVSCSLGVGQSYSPASGETAIRLDISGKGSIFIKLFTKEAPKTTSHILGLVQSGFYDGQAFHRVEKSPKPFLVQIGAPSSKKKSVDDPGLLSEGSGKTVAYEDSGIRNDQEGVVGLSTQPSNRNSGDSQFYILLGPARFLDGNYTVFGRVVAGIEILRKVEKGDRVTSMTVLRG